MPCHHLHGVSQLAIPRAFGLEVVPGTTFSELFQVRGNTLVHSASSCGRAVAG